MTNREPKICRSFDQLPPVVSDLEGSQAFSTRVLYKNYCDMRDALEAISNTGMDAKQCRDTAKATLEGMR